MSYLVHLAYFRPSGRFLAYASTTIDRETLVDIWAEIVELRRIGELPGLRPRAGRDLLILVDVASYPERRVIRPEVDDEKTPVDRPPAPLPKRPDEE